MDDKHTIIGVILAVLGAASLAAMGLFVKMINGNLPVTEVLFFRFLISFIALIPFLFIDPQFTFKLKEPGKMALRAASGLLAMVFFFTTINYLPLADALLLVNTSPVYIPIILFIALGVTTRALVWMGVLISFAGIFLIFRPGCEILVWHSIFGVAAGVLAAIATVALRLMTKQHSTTTLLFYYFLPAALILGVCAIPGWKAPTLDQLGLLVLVGIFGALYQGFLSMSLHFAQIRVVAPIILISVVFGGFLDWVFYAEVPGIYMFMGAITIIIGAGIVISFSDRRIQRDHHKKLSN